MQPWVTNEQNHGLFSRPVTKQLQIFSQVVDGSTCECLDIGYRRLITGCFRFTWGITCPFTWGFKSSHLTGTRPRARSRPFPACKKSMASARMDLQVSTGVHGVSTVSTGCPLCGSFGRVLVPFIAMAYR